MSHPIPLEERLTDCAARWAEANSCTTARLGRLVANDTSFFTRLARPDASTTIAMASRFARFMADASNWPDGAVPQEAFEFAHVTGISTAPARASAGKAGDMSTGQEAA